MTHLHSLNATIEAEGGKCQSAFQLIPCYFFIVLPRKFLGSQWRNILQPWFPQFNLLAPQWRDFFRLPLQLLWILLFIPSTQRKPLRPHGARWLPRYLRLSLIPFRVLTHHIRHRVRPYLTDSQPEWIGHYALLNKVWDRTWLRMLVYAIISMLLMLTITLPFGTISQIIFLALLLTLVFMLRTLPGSTVTLLLTIFSVVISARYIWWRMANTLNWDHSFDLAWGLILLAAELYAFFFLVSSYMQTVWPLHRKPVALPSDLTLWPHVDVYIPTYNEPLKVVVSTVYAAMGLDWPADRLHIHILDDGRRNEFRQFAARTGVNYVVRRDNLHAKAGNINHALGVTSSEFIAFFDSDHIPSRFFLQTCMGWFLRDPKLALLQTPHHFYSPDPFERNLGTFRRVPNEGNLFYGLIQDGNDLWNASFFCGSCAVIRRSALESIGGIPTDSVTEDAFAALKMHRKGFNSAYINLPQAAGLATESLSQHIGQRIRWARGMAQIFRIDNPFLGKGLSLMQRLCYGNAMLSFFSGFPRLVFLTSPIAFLVFHAYIINAPAFSVLIYVLPHLIHGAIVNIRTQGQYRHLFWAEIYESVLSWHVALPTLVALISPKHGKFNVTAKGGLIEKDYFDWKISRPIFLLIAVNFAGLAFGVYRLFTGPEDEVLTVCINIAWVLYNGLILGGVLHLASEKKQIRLSHRVRINLPAKVRRECGLSWHCCTVDLSTGGISLKLSAPLPSLTPHEKISISLWRGNEEASFPGIVVSCEKDHLCIHWQFDNPEQEMRLTQWTFGRADTWLFWHDEDDRETFKSNLKEIAAVSSIGYLRLVQQLAPKNSPISHKIGKLYKKASWWLPRVPEFTTSTSL